MERKNYKAHISTLLVFLFIGIMSVFFIPTHDDLYVSICYTFRNAFQGSLYYGNGRFLGNTFVRMFLNHVFWDNAIRIVCIGGTIVLSAVLARGYRAKPICFSAFMYLGIGFPISRQVFDWGHGFYNYVPPVFLLLVALYLIKRYENLGNSKWRPVSVIAIFLTMFFAQLFCENSSTMNVLIMVLIFLRSLSKKQPKAAALAGVLGSCVGAFAMFMGPTLLGVAHKLDSYRSVENSLSGLLRRAVTNALDILTTLSASWGLWVAVSLILLLLAQSQKKSIHWILKIALFGFIPFAVFQNFTIQHRVQYGINAVFVLYLLCVTVVLFRTVPKEKHKLLLLILGLILASMGQLLVIHPIGPRCLFITFTLLSILALYILPDTKEDNKQMNLWIRRGLSILAIGVYTVILALHIQTWIIHNARMDYAKEQVAEGKTQVEIILLPYTKMFHCPNDSYVYHLRFHQGPDDVVTIRYITYEEYCAKAK